MKRKTRHIIVIFLMLLNNLLFTLFMGISCVVAFGIHRWWEVGVDLLSVLLSLFSIVWLTALLAAHRLGNVKVSYTVPEN